MKGVIMAGGLGTRLRPLTLDRPKPMVEVLGIPVVDFVKDALVKGGVDEIILTTGFRGEVLSEHVDSWSSDSVQAWVNQEETAMGTAGSVGLLRGILDETFIVGSGDTLASFDVAGLLEMHRKRGAKATMALWHEEAVSEYGVVALSAEQGGEIDSELEVGWISRFQEKPPPGEEFSNLINAGLYIVEPEVFDLIPEGEKFDWSRQVFPAMLEKGLPILAARMEGVWFDIGRPSDLLQAQRVVLENRDLIFTDIPEDANSGSEMDGIVEHSICLPGSIVEAGAIVKNSLLMQGCEISKDADVEGCIIGRGTKVESGCSLVDCVIGDDMLVPAGSSWREVRFPSDDA